MKIPKKKASPAPQSSALRQFQALPPPSLPKKSAGVPVCLRARGSMQARVCVIAPPLNAVEYGYGVPLSDKNAVRLEELLMDSADFQTEKNALVISASRFGVKPSKASTDQIRELVERPQFHSCFDLFVCIGDDAFKFIFGRGKKPSSTTLVGSTIYHPAISGKPLFTFQNIGDLVFTPISGMTSRDEYRATDYIAKRNEVMVKTAKKFGQLLERLHLK